MEMIATINGRKVLLGSMVAGKLPVDFPAEEVCLLAVADKATDSELREFARVALVENVRYVCSAGEKSDKLEWAFDDLHVFSERTRDRDLVVTTSHDDLKEAVWYACNLAHDAYVDITSVVCLLLNNDDECKEKIVEAVRAVEAGWEPEEDAGQITQHEVLEELFNAYPPYKELFEKDRDSHYSDDGDLLLYAVASDIAAKIVNLHKDKDEASLGRIFGFVETLLEKGNHAVRELATVGFLEDVQNHAGWAEIDPEEFVPHLGPRSKKEWEDLNDFWSGKTPRIGMSYQELALAILRERGIDDPTRLQLEKEIARQIKIRDKHFGRGNLSGVRGLLIVLAAILGLAVLLAIVATLLPQ